jgi:hypothetical protein
LLTELKEKRLQWFGHIKRMGGTRILRRALELKCKGETLMGQPQTRWSPMYWKTSRREKRAGKKLKTKDCGENVNWRLPVLRLV